MTSAVRDVPRIGRWMRHDPAIRWLSRLIPLAALNVLLFMGVSGGAQRWLGVETGLPFSSMYLSWVSLLWIGLLGFLISPGCRTRCEELALALPVPASSLWRAHLTAVLIAGTSLLVTALAFMAIARLLLERIAPRREVLFEPALWRMGLSLGVTFVLAAVILQGADPSRRKTPLGGGYFLLVAALLLVGLALVLGLSLLPAPAALLPLGAAALVGQRNASAIPATFVVAPATAGKARARGAAQAGPGPRTRQLGRIGWAWRLYTLIWRDSNKKLAIPHSLMALGSPMLLILGLFFSALVSLWDAEGASAMRFALVPMAWYMLIAFLWPGLTNLHFLDALPLSRRRMFAFLVLPSFLVIAVGLAAGEIGARTLRPLESAVDFRTVDEDGHYYVLAPGSMMAIRWDGTWPQNSAPWGESHRPAVLSPLLPGGRTSIYSPFSTPEGCSIDFVALQLSRAIEATYGAEIPPEDLRRRYLQLDGDGAVVGTAERLPLLEDYPGLRRHQADTWFPLMLALIGVPFFLLTVMVLRTMREGVKDAARKGTIWVIMAVCMVLYLGTLAAGVFDLLDLEALDSFVAILLRQMEAVPGATAGAWAGSLLALAVSYWLAYRRFLRAELMRVQSAGCTL